jgi:tetratricopeptide (TPR) repeat protein
MGRYRAARLGAEEALRLADQLEEKELRVTILESIALALGMEERYDDARARFDEAERFFDDFSGADERAGDSDRYIRAMLSFRGLVAARQGRLADAEADLSRALEIKRRIGDEIGTPEVHVWQGVACELRGAVDEAEAAYRSALDLRRVNRRYFDASALAGLARVVRRPSGAEAVEAERLAVRYRYDDVLAVLRMGQAYASWDDPGGFDAALGRFREALVHGLRFNRFLLDELVSGRPGGAVVRPIAAACVERGADGRRMLESLSAWWQTGSHEPDRRGEGDVSLVDAGVELVVAERAAREREPGAGPPGRTVLEQLGAALERV